MNKKIPIAAAVVIAICAAGFWAYKTNHRSSTTALSYNGTVDVRQVSLAFNGADRIAEVLVQEGDKVDAGQVLAKLDITTLALQVAQAKAQAAVQEQNAKRLTNGSRPEEIAQAKANVSAAAADATQASQQLQRLQNVHNSTNQQAVSKLEIESAQARARAANAKLDAAQQAARLVNTGPRVEDKAAAQAQFQAAQAQYALLQQRINDAELKAPVAGVVRNRLLEVGDMASPQKPVFNLVITQPKWVRIYVSETDLGRIKPDMSAKVTIDSDPAHPMTGKVGYISSVAEFTPKTVQTNELRTSLVYEVRVLVEDANDVLRLGMPATVVLEPAK